MSLILIQQVLVIHYSLFFLFQALPFIRLSYFSWVGLGISALALLKYIATSNVRMSRKEAGDKSGMVYLINADSRLLLSICNNPTE
jgi:hypothetical protein